jgi:acetyl esterase/lipase
MGANTLSLSTFPEKSRIAPFSDFLVIIVTLIGLLGGSNLQAQISITNSGASSNAVNVNGAYVQNFNSLPVTGTNSWTDNTTLPGWYAAYGTTDPTNSYTSLVSASPMYRTNFTNNVLYSLPQHFENNTSTSTYRALGFAPSGGVQGYTGLRFVNNTGTIITGFTVTYEIRWGYSQDDGVDSFDLIAGGSGYTSIPAVNVTPSPLGGTNNASGVATTNSSGNVNGITKTASGSGYTNTPDVTFTGGGGSNALARAVMKLVTSSNSVTLNVKTFGAGSGTLANASTAGWTTVSSSTNKNTTSSSVPDDWNYVTQTVTNINLAPGQELWLDWQFKKEGTTTSSAMSLDNVRVYDFAKNDPAILTQPVAQSAIIGNSVTFNVVASGSSTPSYQWRKNGSSISGATGSSYTIASVQSADVASYDVVVTSGGNSVITTTVPLQAYNRMAVKGPVADASAVSFPTASYTQDASLGDITVVNSSSYTNKFDIYLPNSPVKSNSRPAIIVIHGGGGNDGDKQDTREVQACIEFASHGYVALSLNYKKSYRTTSSGSWSAAWPQNIKDAKTAVRWLRKNAGTYGIDPNRIGAIGFSWGGNEAAMLALTDGDATLDPTAEDGLGVYSNKVACAANFYGAVQIPDYHNMNQFSGNGVPGTAGTMDYVGTPNNYLSASPASRATSLAAPMLLSHGDADLEVMPSQNFALKAALLNAGATVQGVQLVPGGLHSYYLYDTGSHNLNTSQITDVRASTMGFFDKYLLPYAPAITSTTSLSGAAGTAVSYQIAANNSPTSFSQTGLPSTMSLDSITGLISGTLPTSLGTTVVTITATGPYGTATSTLNLVSTDSITVTTTPEGTTPSLLGYNLGHFMTSGDAADWFRYSGANGARVFISASDLQGSTSPGRSKVSNLATFNSNVTAARSMGTTGSTYIKWSDYNYNYDSTAGSNDINYKNAFTALTGLGVDILVNITCSPGTFPLTSATDYAGWWEIYQHYYAQAYLLSRDYGIRRFSMFNEPNNWTGMTEPDWLLRLRICSEAIQAGVADMNAANGKSIVPLIYAPNTANGESKYNTGTDTWGHDAVANRHLKLDGTTSSSWLLMNFYNYQKYSMNTDDTGSLTGYNQDIDALAGYIAADMPGESPFPLVLSEFNVRTGSNYDVTSSNQDSPEDFSALAANCIALSRRAANQLFLFKFGQTEDTTSPYGLAKNGTHYVDNINSASNYGGSTKAAEVYRLFNKAAQGGRSRFLANASSGAAMSSSSGGSGLWRLVTQDPTNGNYYVYLANKKTSGITFSLNLLAWSIADGTPVVVEEVSSTCSGGVTQVANVKSGQVSLGTIPAQSVWLVTIPNQAAALISTTATEDTQVGDGTNSGNTGGGLIAMQARADGTIDGRKAVLIKIPRPTASSSSLKSVLLDLGVATSAGSTAVQAHVYGLTTDSWTEGSSTWSSLGTVLKQGTSAGNQIAQNVALNTGTAPSAKILGQIWVNSTTPSRRMLDVTEFVKSRAGGYASFLVVQEHRWNYSADLTTVRTTGDTQSAGVIITSKEKTGAGARLLAVQTGSASTAPVIFSQPQDQSLNLGATISLSVTTDGSTVSTYQWKKDGVDIVGATGPALVITAAGLTDAGTYTCSVTNSYGTSTSAAATVAVSAAPVLATALKNTTVYVGDTVTLSAAFTGSPNPTYSWTKNGVPIPGATDSTYAFIPAATTESGTYTVTALNTYGSISSSATVSVNALPTSFKNISSASFTYTQNFDGLEKSGTYGIRGTTYAPWVDGGANGSTSFEGWSCTLDQGFPGYRTLNNSSSSNLSTPPTVDQSGLLSMGSSSSSTDRSLGGLPWANNNVYMGMRLKNGTGKVINGCTVSFAVEQFSSTTSGKSDTTVTFATQINAASLKTGTWVSRGVYSPTITSASYANLNGASSANRTIQTVVLSGLNIGPNDDLWVRWTVFSTSSEPLAMAIDDLTINSMVLVNNPQTISFDLSKNNLTYGDLAPVVTASSTSALPVTVTSSATGVVAVGANNLLSIVGAGTAVLTASQAGDGTWAAATPIQRTVQVNPASQNITFALNSATAKVGDPNRLLIATSDADLPVALSSSNPNVAVVNGYTLSIVGPGTATITATQAGNSNFLAALPVEQILNVSLVGPSFVGEFGGASATSDEDRDGISALVEYGLGGSPQSNDSGKLPQPTVQGGYLMMTVVERTNDSTLVIRPESSASVTFPVLGATPIRSVSVNQDGVPVGFARVTYSIPIAGNPTQFMRLRFEVSP